MRRKSKVRQRRCAKTDGFAHTRRLRHLSRVVGCGAYRRRRGLVRKGRYYQNWQRHEFKAFQEFVAANGVR